MSRVRRFCWEYRLFCFNTVSTEVGGNIEKNISAWLPILSRRISRAVGPNRCPFSGIVATDLVFLLHSEFTRTFFIFYATVRGWASRVGVILSSSIVSYSEEALVRDGDGAIFACSLIFLIFLTRGTLFSIFPFESIISPVECLTSLNSSRIRWSPSDTRYFELNKRVAAYFVVCFDVKTAQVTASHVPYCIFHHGQDVM